MKFLVFLTCLLALTPFSYSVDCNSDATYGEVTKSELKQLIADKKVFLVDVNSQESYNKNRIPGAIHFASQTDFSKVLPQDKGSLIVAYCGGVMCTAWKKAAMAACKSSYTNVKHFKGGITGWLKD